MAVDCVLHTFFCTCLGGFPKENLGFTKTPNEKASWSENRENVKTFLLAGCVWLFNQYLRNRSTFFPLSLASIKKNSTCCYALYQWKAEKKGKGSRVTQCTRLPHTPDIGQNGSAQFSCCRDFKTSVFNELDFKWTGKIDVSGFVCIPIDGTSDCSSLELSFNAKLFKA